MKPALAAAAAVLLLLFPATVHADEPTAYEQGVAARLAGNPARARALLTRWLAQHPGDVDAMVQLAYAELALGNSAAAKAGFEAVLAIAPDYADARQGLALIAQRTASADSPGFVAVEGAVSTRSGGQRDWREIAIDGEVAAGPLATLGGRVARYWRFDRSDVEMVGRIGLHPQPRLWLRGHAGGTPNADFRPRIELGLGGDLKLPGDAATVLTFDAAFERYPLQSVTTLSPGLVHYFDDGRAWLSLRGVGTLSDGRLRAGVLARGDYSPRDRWRLFAGAAYAPDTDLGVVTRVHSLFAGAAAPLGRSLVLTGAIGRDWRDGGTDRTEVRIGLKAAL